LVQLNVPTAHLATPSPNQLSPFDRWDVGEDLFKSEDLEHELLDRDLRPFVEECDQMQGIQIITGADDAWAGFASKYLEALRDEFGRKSVWIWGLEESRQAGRVSDCKLETQQGSDAKSTDSFRKNVCSNS